MDTTLISESSPLCEATSRAGTRAGSEPLRALFWGLLSTFTKALLAALLAALILAAVHIRQHPPYSPGSGIGYMLGLAGGSMMLTLLLYPIRKRLRFMQALGPLRHWFKLHFVAGVFGPLLVLYHSTFHVGSFNAGIALASMLLVVASGVVGRFLYRRIHHGLYGSHATLQELQQELKKDLEMLAPLLLERPHIQKEVARFAELGSAESANGLQASWHSLTLGWQRLVTGRRIRRALAERGVSGGTCQDRPETASAVSLARNIDATLRAAQRTAQFKTYERLFSLWHVIHVPFIYMLVFTAIAHVVAVHIY